jgi:hypothetical protein
MSTKVVNVKVNHIRPNYRNLKEWMNDSSNVYICRAGIVFIDKQRYPKESSIFCNPFKIDKDNDREEVLLKYKSYIIDKVKKSPEFVKELLSLKGKILGCWCKPEKCHGDILVELIDHYSN